MRLSVFSPMSARSRLSRWSLLPLLLPLLLSSPAAVQPTVQAIVSDTRIIEGESFTLEVRSTEGDIQSVSQEGLLDFRVVAGPSTSRSVQIINGQVSSTSSFTWTLLPRKTGQQVIPSLSVKVSGTIRRTEPVPIEVVPASEAARPGDQDQAAPLFLVAEVNADEVYRGQQVTVTWTLYARDANISGWEIVSLPNLTGFWTEELFAPNNLQLRPRVIEGRGYYTAVVRRLALFPTRSGELEIDPLVLKIGLPVRSRRQFDPFFDEFSLFRSGRVEHRVVSSPAVAVEVNPIPSAGRPSDYSGLVGRFSISGTLDRSEVFQDEAGTLVLTVRGDGNIKTLETPGIDFPQGLEVFAPKVSSEPSLGDIVGGSRIVEYVIIPRRAGSFTIPQVRLPYFDPATGRYELATAGPFALRVLPRDEARAGSPGFTRREVALLGKDIRFVKTERSRWLTTGKGWYTPGLFLLNLATVLIFAAPWVGVRARSAVVAVMPGWRARWALRTATAMLEQVQGQPVEIYAALSQTVTGYLNQKLRRDTREYTIAEVEQQLAAHGVSDEYRRQLTGILERAAAARFAPVEAGDAEADREALIGVLREVEGRWAG